MKRTFESEFMRAAQNGVMRFEDFQRIKKADPEYLSFIEDMEDGQFDGSIGKDKEEIKIDLDDFKAYNQVVMRLLGKTQDQLKRDFDLQSNNPLIMALEAKIKAILEKTEVDLMKNRLKNGLKHPKKKTAMSRMLSTEDIANSG